MEDTSESCGFLAVGMPDANEKRFPYELIDKEHSPNCQSNC
jgi:hypothetical protein